MVDIVTCLGLLISKTTGSKHDLDRVDDFSELAIHRVGSAPSRLPRLRPALQVYNHTQRFVKWPDSLRQSMHFGYAKQSTPQIRDLVSGHLLARDIDAPTHHRFSVRRFFLFCGWTLRSIAS